MNQVNRAQIVIFWGVFAERLGKCAFHSCMTARVWLSGGCYALSGEIHPLLKQFLPTDACCNVWSLQSNPCRPHLTNEQLMSWRSLAEMDGLLLAHVVPVRACVCVCVCPYVIGYLTHPDWNGSSIIKCLQLPLVKPTTCPFPNGMFSSKWQGL